METQPLIGPVTSLEFTENHLFAGVGPWIHVFSLETKNWVACSKCLPSSRIHGIRPGAVTDGSIQFCVFGQKSIRIVTFDKGISSLHLLQKPAVFKDWIWDVAWVGYGSKTRSTLAVSLGHNSVELYDWRERVVLHRVQCEEICILYCAKFIGTTWEDLALAAGTVFNQLVIWAVCGEKKDGLSQVLHRLEGHQGVIFSIDYHPLLQCLCSVSDDRSLQLWRLDKSNDAEELKLLDWKGVKFTKLHRLYGHTARVWDVRLLDKAFITIGEDSTTCVWDYTGQVMQRFKGHRGKSIWSLGAHPSQAIIATGGGDCSVRLWDLKTKEVTDDFISKTLQLPPNMLEEDYPRNVALLDLRALLILTNEGYLLQFSIDTNTWRTLLIDQDYRSYSVLSLSLVRKYAVLGSIQGLMKVVHLGDGDVVDVKVFEGKIHSIHWLDEGCESSSLLVSGPNGQITLYEVLREDGVMTVHKLLHDFTLPYCKQRWVTSAILLHGEDLLICGDRGGTVHVFDLSDSSSSSPCNTFLKVHGKSGVSHVCFHDDHVYSCGRDGRYVQYSLEDGKLKLLNGNKVAKGFEWLCRLHFTDEETYAFGFHTVNFELWSLNTNQKLLEIECGGGHRDWDFSFYENLAVFVYTKRGSIVIHQGEIQSNQQIIQRPLHGRELTDVKHITTQGNIHVFCTSSEDTYVNIIAVRHNQQGDMSIQPLKMLQGHLSSVRCLSLSSPTSSDDVNDFVYILFSGGGRAQVKVWQLTLKFLPSAERNSNCGTCETCISQKSTDFEFDGAVTCRHKFISEGAQSVTCNHELLSTHMLQYKSRKARKPWKVFEYDPSLETRFMALTSFRATEVDRKFGGRTHFVAAACSDGFLRLFTFCEHSKNFRLLGETGYHDHCLLCVRHLIVEGPSPQVFILSAGTDGKIAFWKVTSAVLFECDKRTEKTSSTREEHESETSDMVFSAGYGASNADVFQEPSCVIRAHQSGVNAIAVQKIETDVYLLASGGDDNALVLTEFSIRDSSDAVRGRQVRHLFAHGAQITGICFLKGLQLLTVSIDQRAIIWNWSLEKETLEVCEVKFVDVADVAACDHWTLGDDNCVVLAGTGLQLLQYGQHKDSR